MISDIVFSWNELTVTLMAWLAMVSLALGVDFGPEIYREKKARAQLTKSVAKLAERKIAKPTFDPNQTFQLGAFKIQPETARRRHARI